MKPSVLSLKFLLTSHAIFSDFGVVPSQIKVFAYSSIRIVLPIHRWISLSNSSNALSKLVAFPFSLGQQLRSLYQFIF